MLSSELKIYRNTVHKTLSIIDIKGRMEVQYLIINNY